jgi:L-malate glycosyltransferase
MLMYIMCDHSIGYDVPTKPINVLFLDNHDLSIHSTLNAYYLNELNQHDEINLVTVIHPEYSGILTQQNLSIYPITFNSKCDLSAIRQIKMIINKHKIDLIHCQGNRPLANAILASYLTKTTPKIFSRRGIVRKLNRFDPAEWITTLNPRHCHTIALSKAIANDLVNRSNLQKSEITTIYQAIDLDWLGIDRQFNLKKHLKLPEQSIIIGTVANFRPIKGLDLFIHAINQFEQHPNIHWVIIGKYCQKNLAHLIQSKNLTQRVHFLGYQDKPGNFVQGFDIYVQPSRSEGLGYALIEAMLLKVCPIISNVGGMPELVTHMKHGMVFSKNNTEELVTHIKYLLKHSTLRIKLGNEAKRNINQKLSLQQMTKETVKLYKRISKL